MSNEIKVGIVGTQFMGRAHSNAYRRVSDFFDLPAPPLLRAACDVNPSDLDAFAQRFGWQTKETSWEKMVSRDDIDPGLHGLSAPAETTRDSSETI